MKKFSTLAINRLRNSAAGFIALMMLSLSGFSQGVAINTTLAPANTSAGLDVSFPNKGFLLPRVALVGLSSVSPLAAHVAGMILFNTATTADVTPGIYFDNGTTWVAGTQAGSARGQMQYWNGTAWTTVAPGIAGQYLSMGAGGIPAWTGNASGYATLSTDFGSAITTTSATSGGNITNNGGTAVTARGVCWSTSQNPTVALSTKTVDGSGNGAFTSSITGLTTATTYYIRAYATNGLGTEYGNQVTITTN
ncbi:MAG: hypothetical protein WCI92_18805 [Bacteroidota bacterium]